MDATVDLLFWVGPTVDAVLPMFLLDREQQLEVFGHGFEDRQGFVYLIYPSGASIPQQIISWSDTYIVFYPQPTYPDFTVLVKTASSLESTQSSTVHLGMLTIICVPCTRILLIKIHSNMQRWNYSYAHDKSRRNNHSNSD